MRGMRWAIALRDAAAIVAGCALVALVFNAVRGDGIPLVQKEEYQILVPCPETMGDATALAPDAPALRSPRALVVDARPAAEFERWHTASALNVPYDYLEPTPPAVIQRIAASGAAEVIVYGDGADPDSGEQLARELSGKGIRNVSYVTGGAAALQKGAPSGGQP
ncbi:MAG: rhodanese-like domain-containing protein [Deltaproteobacteria bacterium]|nr:rhodanese-like domain-containing protein [Deltaproteobacteria bacterium]